MKDGRVHIETVKTERFEMDIVVFGLGKKQFVMIPGMSMAPITDSAEGISQAYSRFANEYTVYCIDRKKDIGDKYSIEEMARDTAECMMELGIHNACVLGVSLGGMIAQHIAIQYPQLIKKLVLGSTQPRMNNRSRELMSEWMRLAHERKLTELNRLCFRTIYSEEFCTLYKDVLAAMENAGTEEQLRHFEIIAQACLNYDCYDELEKIKAETYVIGSKKDAVLTEQGSIEIAEKMHCRIYLYEGYSHAVYDEAPDYKKRLWQFFEG